MRAGAPTIYTDELIGKILTRIMEGESVAEICRDETMPDKATFYRWLGSIEGLCDKYARAKEVCADMMAEEILEIADDATNDWMMRNNDDDENHSWSLNGEHVQRSRLRIDSRKFLMAKLKPKKYGDKLDLGVKGSLNITIGTDDKDL